MFRGSYKQEMIIQLAFALFVQNKINEIYNVLKPVSRAKDIGVPELGDTPFTPDMAKSFDLFINSSNLSDCKTNANSVFKSITGYFKTTFELISETFVKAEKEIDRIENHTDKPIVSIRDFNSDPIGAKIIYALATRFNGIASIKDLQYAFPELYEDMEDIVNNINSEWMDIITIDPNSEVVTLNSTDLNSICALVDNHPIDPDIRLSEVIEKHNNEMGILYTLLENVVEDKYIEYTRKKQREYFNKNLVEYPTLFKTGDIVSLRKIDIHTTIDFLECDLTTLKFKTNLPIEKIIKSKLILASKLGWNPENFELNIVPPSIFANYNSESVLHSLRQLREFFNDENLTYGKILAEKEIILNPIDASYRKICYRAISFIRDFSDKCLHDDIYIFTPYPKTWTYKMHLKASEKNTMDIKKINILNKTNISKKVSKRKVSESQTKDISKSGETKDINKDPNNLNQETVPQPTKEGANPIE